MATRAVTSAGDLYEVAVAPSGAFTVVVTFAAEVSVRGDGGVYRFPPGTACALDDGQGWRALDPAHGERV